METIKIDGKLYEIVKESTGCICKGCAFTDKKNNCNIPLPKPSGIGFSFTGFTCVGIILVEVKSEGETK